MSTTRKIFSCVKLGSYIETDVLSVLEAFSVTCPACQVAVDALLHCGEESEVLPALEQAKEAVERAIQMQKEREALVARGKVLPEIQPAPQVQPNMDVGADPHLPLTMQGMSMQENSALPQNYVEEQRWLAGAMKDTGLVIGWSVFWGEPSTNGEWLVVKQFKVGQGLMEPTSSWCQSAASQLAEKLNAEGAKPTRFAPNFVTKSDVNI